ncbi:sigma-70 family RNA polymerase sigma factor [Methyloversatilis thermotolerans]|uniref:sigma-70 family RNA polymerase sigma factor n=1 Tax=Methyloversatilis thermotolerans TaxID=1346290 RepID=UPI0003A9A266|nr:sigma-70 family RNA polymerase sigma factor [Methyloversatilis thermotolerans]
MSAVPPVAALYADHHAWLQGWLRRKVRCPDHAADLMHDTFIKVMLNCTELQIREPRAYLATIADRLTMDFFRRQRIERSYLDALATLPQTHWPSAEESVLFREALIELDRLLEGLGPQIKQAFLLAQFDTLSYADIAARLGISVRSVNNYVAKAMLHCCLALA